jgi:biopolymer transport protein ExbB
MVEQLKNFLVHTGATWVLWVLIGLSVVSVAVMIDRARAFWAQRDDVAKLVSDLHHLLRTGDLAAAEQRLAKSPSAAAAVVRTGLAHWDRGGHAAREAMAAATGLERARLERRLLFLGTVGNNAPFVGLLGTVIGVVGAFAELGTSSGSAMGTAVQLAPERVMSTIAEALVATAVGLVVAIPAVAVFNYFQGLLAEALGDADTLGHVLLAHIGDVSSVEPRRKG